MDANERRERIDEEIDRRIKLVADIESQGQKGMQLALDYYADHLVEWVNDFAWTYDPRNPSLEVPLPAYVPMKPEPVQAELLEWMQWLRDEGKDGWVPKGRGVGVSYFASAYQVHRWLFEGGYSGSFLSMTEEEVDQRNDPDSLFQKLRILLEWVPGWMLPEGFWVGQDSPFDNHRRLTNPETGAIITGKIGRSPGRGGRSSAVFVDEAAHIRNLEEARRAYRENTNTAIEMSTYRGTGEPFYRSCQKGGPQVFLITWEMLPSLYDEDWYERKKIQYADDPVGFAQEVEADPTQSVENIVIPQKWVKACVEFEPVEATPRPVVAALDVAGDGANKNVLIIRRGPWVEMPEVKSDGNTTRTAHWARTRCDQEGARKFFYDSIGIGAGVGDTLLSMHGPDAPTFDVTAFNAGERPSEAKWPNGRTSRERFANKKAEAWWMMRDRCRKTYERMEGIEDHPIEECISLPDCPDLTQQLSQPTYEHTHAGKIKIESKDDMEARGIPSPDHADALVMTEAQYMLDEPDPVDRLRRTIGR